MADGTSQSAQFVEKHAFAATASRFSLCLRAVAPQASLESGTGPLVGRKLGSFQLEGR
jgi:hypothetical protein